MPPLPPCDAPPHDAAPLHGISESMLVGMLTAIAEAPIAEAEALLRKGDSDVGMVHENRYAAIRVLRAMVAQLLEWGKECEGPFIAGEIAPALSTVATEAYQKGKGSGLSEVEGEGSPSTSAPPMLSAVEALVRDGVFKTDYAEAAARKEEEATAHPQPSSTSASSRSSAAIITVSPQHTFTSLLLTITVAKAMLLMGIASVSAQETLAGYKVTEHAMIMMEHVHLHGKGLTCAQLERCVASAKRQYTTSGGVPSIVFCADDHYAQFKNHADATAINTDGDGDGAACTHREPAAEGEGNSISSVRVPLTSSVVTLGSLGLGLPRGEGGAPSSLRVRRERVSYAGSAILLEIYIYMCMCASRWDNPEATVALINAAHRLSTEVRQRREGLKREGKTRRVDALQTEADAVEDTIAKARQADQASQEEELRRKLEARMAARRQKKEKDASGNGGAPAMVPAPPSQPMSSPQRPSATASPSRDGAAAPPSAAAAAAAAGTSEEDRQRAAMEAMLAAKRARRNGGGAAGSGAAAAAVIHAAPLSDEGSNLTPVTPTPTPTSAPAPLSAADVSATGTTAAGPPLVPTPPSEGSMNMGGGGGGSHASSASPRRVHPHSGADSAAVSPSAPAPAPAVKGEGTAPPPSSLSSSHSMHAVIEFARPTAASSFEFIHWAWGNGKGIGGAEGTEGYLVPLAAAAPSLPPTAAEDEPSPPTDCYNVLEVLQLLHRVGFDTEAALQRLEGNLLTSSAQVNKTANSTSAAAFCHRSLSYQVEKHLLKTSADVGDWVSATMSLAEYYLSREDLSHAEHCLLAVEEILEMSRAYVPKVVDGRPVTVTAKGTPVVGPSGGGAAVGATGGGMCDAQFVLPPRSLRGAGLGPFPVGTHHQRAVPSSSPSPSGSGSTDRPHAATDLWASFDVLQYHFAWATYYHRVMLLGQGVYDATVSAHRKGIAAAVPHTTAGSDDKRAAAALTQLSGLSAALPPLPARVGALASSPSSPPSSSSPFDGGCLSLRVDAVANVMRPLGRAYGWVTANAFLNPLLLPEALRSAPTEDKEAFVARNCGSLLTAEERGTGGGGAKAVGVVAAVTVAARQQRGIEGKESLSLEEALTGVADEEDDGPLGAGGDGNSWCAEERIAFPLPNLPPPRRTFTFAFPRKAFTAAANSNTNSSSTAAAAPEQPPSLFESLSLRANRSTMGAVLPAVLRGDEAYDSPSAASKNRAAPAAPSSSSANAHAAALLLVDALRSTSWVDHCQQRLLFHIMAARSIATIDADFEKFLHLQRMEADSWSVCYNISDLPVFDISLVADADSQQQQKQKQLPSRAAADASSSSTVYSVSAALGRLPTHKDDALLQLRVGCLEAILATGLNVKSYRNVIRQAEYDCGGSCALIAANAGAMADVLRLGGTVTLAHTNSSNTTPSSQQQQQQQHHHGGDSGHDATVGTIDDLALRRADYLEKALAYYKSFVGGFHAEMAEAREEGKGIEAALDASDYPTIVVGEMKVAELLLKVGRTDEAKARLEEHVLAFIKANPQMLVKYPEVAASRVQCEALLEALGEVRSGGGGSNPSPSSSASPTAPTAAALAAAAAAPTSTTTGAPQCDGDLMDAIE